MNSRIISELKKEILARGFRSDGAAPNGTMVLDEGYLAGVDLADLLDTMVSRREKIFRSSEVVGADVARQSYDDVVLVIDAIKSVVGRLIQA
jgi:hypothetical protein